MPKERTNALAKGTILPTSTILITAAGGSRIDTGADQSIRTPLLTIRAPFRHSRRVRGGGRGSSRGTREAGIVRGGRRVAGFLAVIRSHVRLSAGIGGGNAGGVDHVAAGVPSAARVAHGTGLPPFLDGAPARSVRHARGSLERAPGGMVARQTGGIALVDGTGLAVIAIAIPLAHDRLVGKVATGPRRIRNGRFVSPGKGGSGHHLRIFERVLLVRRLDVPRLRIGRNGPCRDRGIGSIPFPRIVLGGTGITHAPGLPFPFREGLRRNGDPERQHRQNQHLEQRTRSGQ